MNNKKTTKRALLSSVMAIVLCLAMLIGTTFAWFTDTASTGVNKIQAGTLQIGLEMKNAAGGWDDAEGASLAWKKASGTPSGEATLWEPGVTYELPLLKITNLGNLETQFQVQINGITGKDKNGQPSTKLLDALNFEVVFLTDEEYFDIFSPDQLAALTSSFGGSYLNNLPYQIGIPSYITQSDPGLTGIRLRQNGDGGDTFYVRIRAHMDESANNDYQGLSLDNIGITVVATQLPEEYDSFGNQYDKDAEYPAITVGTTLDDVFTGLTDKDGNGVDFGVNAPAKDVSVNGQGIATVTGFADAWVAGDVTIKGVKFLNGACFTAKENGTVGTLTLEDCTFYACDQSKIDLAPYAYNSLKNSGDGLCLNVDTKDSPNLKVVIKNCRFIGENDPTLNRDGWKDIGGTNWDPDTAVKNKSRGHAVMINGICGGGNNATAESVLIEGCTMDGIRGHAIQLYKLRMGVTVKDCTINSWGNNAQTAAGTKSDAAIRGDIVVGSGNLTVTNTRFGLNESTSLRHINVDNYSGNTNGSRVAGTY